MLRYGILVFLIPLLIVPSFAQESQISVYTNNHYYENGEIIVISGKITNYDPTSKEFFSFIVLSPDNKIMTVGQGSPLSDGSFQKSLLAGGPLWKLAGEYVIDFRYDEIHEDITINYAGGDQIITTPEPTCVGCSMEDARAMANQFLLDDLPVSVWTDKTDYGHNDMIIVTGQVANVSGFPITVTVVSPLISLVTHDELTVTNDGSFGTTINTAGAMWKYDGTYTIKVNYGSPEKSNSVKVELTGGVAYTPNYSTPTITSIRVQTDDNHYDEGDTIVISGSVNTVIGKTPLILQIFYESTYIDLSQIEVAQDGTFSKTIIAEGPLWDKAGEYLVRVSYQDQKTETVFNYTSKSASIETTTNFEADEIEIIQNIPNWIKNVFLWYGQDALSEKELLEAIKYLIYEEILIIN